MGAGVVGHRVVLGDQRELVLDGGGVDDAVGVIAAEVVELRSRDRDGGGCLLYTSDAADE